MSLQLGQHVRVVDGKHKGQTGRFVQEKPGWLAVRTSDGTIINARRSQLQALPIGAKYQAEIPNWRPHSLDEDDTSRSVGKRIRLDKTEALVAHNFIEEHRGKLMERIHTFMKKHPKVTPEALAACKRQGLDQHIRAVSGKWYVYRGG